MIPLTGETEMSNLALKALATIALWLVAITCFASSSAHQSAMLQSARDRETPRVPKVKSVLYLNKKYGFRFILPMGWRGFSISVSEWEGGDGRTYQPGDLIPPSEKGPLISIGHPLSTVSNPRQNIPIMIFTKAQWQMVRENKLILSAAPIGPSELGRNTKYVFALPARYNYAFPLGYEEVDQIVRHHSLRPF
jgi:hypothetical protein